MPYQEVCTWTENAKGYLVKTCRQQWVPDPPPKPPTTIPKAPAAAPAPAPTNPPPSPPKWYFNGRIYYSQSAYQSAVAAYNQARGAAAVEAQRRQQMLATAAKQRADAAAAARMRLESAATAQAARARAEAARREAMALARRQAFENLQKRWQMVLGSDIDQQRKAAFNRQMAAERQKVSQTGNAGLDDRLRRTGETISAADLQRKKMIETARATGDYEAVFARVREQQRQTGGRYVDRTLYDQANTEARKLLDEVRDERDVLAQKIYAAFQAQNWDEVIALSQSPEWLEADGKFQKYYGDGRGNSPAERWAALQREIGNDQDRWMSDQVLQRGTGGLSDRQLDERFSDFERDNLREKLPPLRQGQRPIDESYREITLNNWLKRQDEEQRLRDGKSFEYQSQRLRGVMNHGYYGEKVEFDSRGQLVDSASVVATRQADSMRQLFTGGPGWVGVTSKAEYASLLDTLQNSTLQVDRDRALRELMSLGMDAYRERYKETLRLIESQGNERDVHNYSALRGGMAEDRYRVQLERWLTGSATDGVGRAMQQLTEIPGINQALYGWNAIVGGSTSAARLLVGTVTGGGNLAFPDLQYDALFGSGNELLSDPDAIDASPEAKARWRQDISDLMRIIGDPNSPLDRRIEAINAFGRGWASGNTAILGEAALDPLSFLTVGRFLRGGRLAVAEAGGLRGARQAFGSTVNDFFKFSMPEGFGGLNPNDLSIIAERERVARLTGRSWADVKAMNDVDYNQLVQTALKEAREKAAAPVKGLDAEAIRSQQLLSSVADELEGMIRRRPGINRVTSADLQSQTDYANRAVAQAAAQERALVARATRIQAETVGADALEAVRREQARRGVAPAIARAPDVLTPYKKGQRTALVRQHMALVSERVTVARKAADAAKLVDEARDGQFRTLHYDSLNKAVARLRELDDELVSGTVNDGAVTRARKDLEAFDATNRSGDNARPFLGVVMGRVNQDVKYIQSEIIRARARLNAASTPGEIRHWSLRLKQLGGARDYLDVERRTIRGAKPTAKRAVRKHAAAVARSIGLNRVAARAVTAAAGKEHLLRDLRRRAYGATVDKTFVAPNADELAQFASVAAVLPAARLTKDSLQILTDMRAQFGDVELLDLAYALWAAGEGGFLSPDVQSLWSSLKRQVRQGIADQRGVPLARVLPDEVDSFMDAYRSEQLIKGGRLSLRQYRKLDDAVATAIRDARGFTAEGQIVVRPSRKTGSTSSGTRHDAGMLEMYAKLAALKTAGVSLEQYDQARTVLGDINLRLNRGTSLRRRAQVISRKTGRPVEDVFDQLREKARLDEVAQNLERLAYRHPELSEDELFSLYELQMIDADLASFTKRPLNSYQAELLEGAYKDLSGADLADNAAADRLLGNGASEHPPFGNRGAMRDWMIENGHWSPRTADAIRSGDRVFGIDAERDFWESGFGHVPDWTKPDLLLPLLRNWDAYVEQFRLWGVFNDDFEKISVAANLSGEKLRDAMVFGGDGIQRARSWQEMRRWAIERYGSVVSPDGKKLTEMPWLMNLDEYDDWLARAVFDEPLMKASGIEFDKAMLKGAQIDSFRAAVSDATRKAFERAKAQGEFDEAWLPQEQVRFVMNIVDNLMADPKWRSFFEKRPAGARVLDNIGAFWRAAMTWTLAFPIMNLIDSVTGKRNILAATQNGFRPLSRVSDVARESIPNADALGGRQATWYLRGRHGFVNASDSQFDRGFRLREAARGFTELPLRVSKLGEDRLRLDFGRSMFDLQYNALIKSGVSDDLARPRALLFATGKVDQFFPNTANMGAFERVLNQLIPFFSYNLNLKVLSVKMAIDNPWLLTMGERLGDLVEDMNRDWWEEEHPGVPFPSGDPAARQLWVKMGDTTYTIDLSMVSDFTRGLQVLNNLDSKSGGDLATAFFRVPHPSQAIFLAVAFGFNGGKTPWGTEARWEDVSLWFDLASWLRDGGSSAFDPNDPRSRDAIQMWSQMLFFNDFGRISPMKVKVQQYFGFMALDRKRAFAYLDENPDLRAYFALNGSQYRIQNGVKVIRRSWLQTATDAEKADYEAAYDGFRALRLSLDAKLDQFYLEPWSPEYRQWKRQRRALLTEYLKDHRILGDVWGYHMEPSEFADLQEEWLTDEMVDAYFALDKTRPERASFGEGTAGELEFARETAAWFDMRAAWLTAHPQVYDQLHRARNEVERAWFEHELQWADTLEQVSDVKIKILETELHLETATDDEDARALLNALHEFSASQYNRLDAESFGEFYDLLRNDRGIALRLPNAVNNLMGRIKTTVTFPGRSDFFYERATPAQRKEIEANERYAAGFDQLWANIGNDVTRFYDELAKDPWLKAEYFRRNPDKHAAFLAGNEYRDWMGQWVAMLQRNDFDSAQRIWDSMPAWVHERYFAKHPDSKMRDGMGGGGGGTAVQYNGRWFKSPESRDRYIAFIENGGGAERDFPDGFADAPSFRSPESRQRFLDGQAYFAAMQKWVELLRAKDYVASDAHFRSLPEWMREKYYAKNPGQRAKNELDSASLRLGAEYFLAGDDATKLSLLQRNPALRTWLAEHGGEEAAMRGLITSIYRAIPSGEAWLKRTFRERYPEVFSQEAAGQRRVAKVARELAENPEMAPFYEKAFALQSKLYTEQLKLSKKAPRPMQMERKRRLRKRTRRRAARFHSSWAMHYEARRGIRNSAGS